MGKSRWIIQLGAALVLSLAAGGLAMKFMGAPQEKVAVAAKPEVTIVVVADDVRRGMRLTPDKLKTATFLKESLPAGHFLEIDQLKDRFAAVPLAKGEPVVEARLLPENAAAAGISSMITPGKRAFTVKGNKVLGLAGFIRPGNRVDVLVTLETDHVEGGKVMTKTVLENVLVLATDTEIEEAGDGDPAPVDTYTLELTPGEGEKLSLAATRGTLHFALRNPEDGSKVLTGGASVGNTLASLRPEVRKRTKSARRVPKQPPQLVQVIVGNESKTLKF